MIRFVEQRKPEIAELCRRFHVRTLDLFGSAVDEQFKAGESDLDFLVTFEPCTPSEHYARYFGLVESLEALFGCRVDLVEAAAMRNPYFMRRVNETRAPLYAA